MKNKSTLFLFVTVQALFFGNISYSQKGSCAKQVPTVVKALQDIVDDYNAKSLAERTAEAYQEMRDAYNKAIKDGFSGCSFTKQYGDQMVTQECQSNYVLTVSIGVPQCSFAKNERRRLSDPNVSYDNIKVNCDMQRQNCDIAPIDPLVEFRFDPL